MDCPRCQSNHHRKAGIVHAKQRYECKACGYYYTVQRHANAKPEETKRLALRLYLEGMGLRAIGRVLNVSHVSVYRWVKAYARSVSLPAPAQLPAQVVELDELYTYVGSKKALLGLDGS